MVQSFICAIVKLDSKLAYHMTSGVHYFACKLYLRKSERTLSKCYKSPLALFHGSTEALIVQFTLLSIKLN